MHISLYHACDTGHLNIKGKSLTDHLGDSELLLMSFNIQMHMSRGAV